MFYHIPYDSTRIAEWYCSQPETSSEYAKMQWKKLIPVGYEQCARLLVKLVISQFKRYSRERL